MVVRRRVAQLKSGVRLIKRKLHGYVYVRHKTNRTAHLTVVASFVQPGLGDVVFEHVLDLVDALDEPG